MNALIFDNSIEIETKQGPIFFTSFLSRDQAFNIIEKVLIENGKNFIVENIEEKENINLKTDQDKENKQNKEGIKEDKEEDKVDKEEDKVDKEEDKEDKEEDKVDKEEDKVDKEEDKVDKE